MATYSTTVHSSMSPEHAFAYMADLRNFAEWDPGVRKVVQVSGDGAGSGTEFDVTVAGPGRDLTLRYRTIEFEPSTNLLVRAQSTLFTSIDRVTVAESETGTTVTYDAELRLNGIGALFDPVLRLAFGRIGDRATAGLRRVLA